ncbi:MAG: aldo/keto reductase [Hyphomicrobiales bacterium]
MHTLSANGANMPAIGFGTWTLRNGEAARLVAGAIDDGYRHVDTAAMYENEKAVGEGIRHSGVARDEIFLTTKVWFSDLADGELQRSVEESLKKLNQDSVDLVLIHWPSKTVPLAESMRALNEVADAGMTRNIGVSNFTTAMIEVAVRLSSRPLACNQVEYHPCLNQDAVLECCRRHGMAMISYCPLFRGGDILAEPAIEEIAEKHGKTPAQIVLRWHIEQEDVGAIPRSSNPERIRQNLDVSDFSLNDEDMAAITGFRTRNERICDFDFSPEWD